MDNICFTEEEINEISMMYELKKMLIILQP